MNFIDGQTVESNIYIYIEREEISIETSMWKIKIYEYVFLKWSEIDLDL